MRRVALLLLASATAHADPRDAFGFHKPAAATTDCSDGTAFGCVGATDPLDDHASPYTLSTWLAAPYLLSLPVANATHDQLAHYALGASEDGAGVSIAGANGLENRWLVDGAPADGIHTGAADTRLPLAFTSGMLVIAGGFTARDRASTGGIIDAQLRRGTPDHRLDARVFAGWTAEARQRAIAPQSYYVRRGSVDVGPEASASLVGTGPLGELLGGHAWYAAGIAPELHSTRFTWRAASVVDADQDGFVDGLPGIVVTKPIDSYSQTPLTWRLPLMARLGLDGDVHHVELTLVGTAASAVSYLSNATLQAAGVDATNVVGDAIATWRGTWTNTRARAQLAWHRASHHEWARDPAAAGVPQLQSAYVPATLPDDPQLAAACADGTASDAYPLVTNCPAPYALFASGGAGRLSDVGSDRPSVTADVAHRIDNNVVRVGATGEDTREIAKAHFTGGELIRSAFVGHTQERRFVDPTQTCHLDITQPCPTVDTSRLRYRTRYTAAYVEDTWHPDPAFAVDGGLRWELMWVGSVLHFSDQFAPRLGASWDPLGGGRSRIWTSMGRSYALLPTGLGPTILAGESYVDHTTLPIGESRSVTTGAPLAIAPGILPITQDELTAGAEVALAAAVHARAWIQGRWLRRGIETTGGQLDNPQGDALATRETGLVAVELTTAPTARLVLRAGYEYGRTVGSWTGAYDPREGAVLYAGNDFDGSVVNQLGRLPTDMGHRAYIEGQRGGELGSVKLSVATRLTVGSGRPRDVLANSDDGIIYLIPRGGGGRAPLATQANIRIAARWRSLDITLDLFNVFDRRDATAVDEVYADGAVRPIAGGTTADLPFLKTDTGGAARRLPGYGYATAFQSPLAVVLGLHESF